MNLALERTPESTHRRMFTDAMIVSAGTATAKVAGAVKVIVMARFFGASDALDAFLIAFLLPSFFADVIAGCLTAGFVPLLIETRAKSGVVAARVVVASALAFGVALLSAIAVALALAGRWVLPLLGSSFPPEKLALAESMFFLLLLWLPMSACIAVWRAVMNACGEFALAAVVPILTPLLTILSLWLLYSRWGVLALCAGTLAGVLAETLVLSVAAARRHYPVLPRWKGWSPQIAALTRRYFPLTASGIASSAAMVINQAVAGTLGSGGVSALSYGNRLVTVLGEITATALGTAALPAFSRMTTAGDWASLRRAATRYAGLATLASVPATAALILVAENLVRIAFQRGAFDVHATQLVSTILRYSLLQLPLVILFTLLSRLAVSVGANGVIARVAAAALVINLVGALVMARYMGLAGIAASTSITQGCSLALLFVLLRRSEPRLFRQS